MRFILCLLLMMSNLAFDAQGASKLKIAQLSATVFQHTSLSDVDTYGLMAGNGLIVIEGKQAYLIDTPWSAADTKTLIQWVTAKGLTIGGVIITHFHLDSSGGLAVFNKLKIKTYATTLTNQLLKANNREPANNEITSDTFDLVSGAVQVYYPGPGHTRDNVVVWLAKSNLLFGGCLVQSFNSRKLLNIEDASIRDWPKSLQNVMAKYPNIDMVIPGPGQIGDVSLLELTQQLARKSQ
ncbi:subclass B1 metallo-beta-lactamase [Shewanella sp.]|uniref:subclass B1 metallo-beta-lactamase n=1 Tax=Shewanella sp. TaxID=50422 RepID=UPI00405497EF